MSAQSQPATSTTTPTLGQRLKAWARCATNACPRCGKRPIASLLSFKASCPHCELLIDKGNGFLLGALPISYGLFVIFWLIPMLLAWIFKYLEYSVAFGLIAAGAIIWPLLIYNYCKMLSLGLYYFFMTHELLQPPSEINTP